MDSACAITMSCIMAVFDAIIRIPASDKISPVTELITNAEHKPDEKIVEKSAETPKSDGKAAGDKPVEVARTTSTDKPEDAKASDKKEEPKKDEPKKDDDKKASDAAAATNAAARNGYWIPTVSFKNESIGYLSERFLIYQP